MSPLSSIQMQAMAELELRRRSESGVVDASSNMPAYAYVDDPVGFIKDFIIWKPNEHPADYQNEVMTNLSKLHRESVRGPHGLGKTALIAWLILWFAETNDGLYDWKIPVTASAWRQLTKYAMPEVHKWARRLNWSKLGHEPYNDRTELTQLSLRLKTGEMFALASDNAALIEGAHADKLFYIFDESKEIPAPTWDAAEGAFSTGNCYWLAASTPGEPQGRFYDIQSKQKGYEDWHVTHITLDQVMEQKPGFDKTWPGKRKLQWGEKSAVYQNRVAGEFASSEADGVIPLAWVEAANRRWEEFNDLVDKPVLLFAAVGVDVARSGEDKTVMALRYDAYYIDNLRKTVQEDTMQTTGRVAGILTAHGGKAVVDVIGIGAGVVDRLREMKVGDIIAFNASEHSDQKDKSGELGFVNKRAAIWWGMHELLDPANANNIMLPVDDDLLGDLVAPHWKVMSGGKIQIESKDEIKERLGRSTDCGDAVTMAFFDDGLVPLRSWVDAWTKHSKKSEAVL